LAGGGEGGDVAYLDERREKGEKSDAAISTIDGKEIARGGRKNSILGQGRERVTRFSQ